MRNEGLTVAIMARNEDWFVERSIRSAIEVSDDVLVGDMGSSDATPEIADKLGCRVIQVPTDLMVESGWAACRNWMSHRAKHNWILVLDADEVLPQDSIDILKKDEWPWQSSVIITPTHTWKCPVGMPYDEVLKTQEFVTFPHRRMYNRHKAMWLGIIHEELHFHTAYKPGQNASPSADPTGVIRWHFTGMRPKRIDRWKKGVDAQLLLRAESGVLTKEGVNPGWFTNYVPQKHRALVERAELFFQENPRYDSLRKQIRW